MIMSLAETRIVMLQVSLRAARQAELQKTTQVAEREAEKARQEKSESDKQLKASLASLEAIQRELAFLTEQDKTKEDRLGQVGQQNDDLLHFLSESAAQF